MDFKSGDPAFPPVLAAVTGDFGGPLLFMPVSGTYTRTRPEWKRVKSHGARLQVKIAPLQLLDF